MTKIHIIHENDQRFEPIHKVLEELEIAEAFLFSPRLNVVRAGISRLEGFIIAPLKETALGVHPKTGWQR